MYALETLPVSDFTKATIFWTAVLSTVGYAPQHQFPMLQAFGKSPDRPSFAIGQGSGNNPYKSTFRLQVESDREVESVFRKAITAGGKEIQKPRNSETANIYTAAFYDLDANRVEVYYQKNGGLAGGYEKPELVNLECRAASYLDLQGNMVEV